MNLPSPAQRLHLARSFAAAGFAVAFGASAVPVQVPLATQAMLIGKILSYDRSLAGKGKLRVLVLGEGAESVAEAFNAGGLQAEAINTTALGRKLVEHGIVYADDVQRDDRAAGIGRMDVGASVVYWLPGADKGRIKALCEQHKVLSLSGVSAMADDGTVSVGLGTRPDGAPQIIINLQRSKVEAHEFSTDLLRLARIVQ